TRPYDRPSYFVQSRRFGFGCFRDPKQISHSDKNALDRNNFREYCTNCEQIHSPKMRKINSKDFKVATRTTSRDINRRITLNRIRENQPLSRADLARKMKITRGVAGTLVQELIDQRMIVEGSTGDALRGRKPTFLHIRTHDRLVI